MLSTLLTSHDHLRCWYERRANAYIHAFVEAPEEARNSNLMDHCGMIAITVGIMLLLSGWLLSSVVLFCKRLVTMASYDCRTNDFGSIPCDTPRRSKEKNHIPFLSSWPVLGHKHVVMTMKLFLRTSYRVCTNAVRRHARTDASSCAEEVVKTLRCS